MCGGREDYDDVVPCRNCGSKRYRRVEVDLGDQPLANALAESAAESVGAPRYPLATGACPDCGLVQLYRRPPVDLFGPAYPFRQGTSETWVRHLWDFAADLTNDLHHRRALDVGANDGTLVGILHDVGFDSWGVDPAPSGPFPVMQGHMGIEWAQTYKANGGGRFDLITAFNVLAHVSDLDDFLGGIMWLLQPKGRLVVEVPDWSRSSWMSVYHEHQCYFTKETLTDCLQRRGFLVVAMESQPTHEGSWRATCTIA